MLHGMTSFTTHHPFSLANHLRTTDHHHHHHLISPIQPATRVIRCRSNVKRGNEAEATRDYYQLLGVPVDSSPKEIREAYRTLQKKHHPDIAGQKGHEYTLMLNEAYSTLMREDLRKIYDISSGKKREGVESNFTGLGYSSWNGPIRPQALFVDENRCIGCRECVHHASKTFMMDEANGSARVKMQFGDNEQQIEVSMESCPTNCIHWVESEEVALLEYLIVSRPREGHGVFGGGWERPRNVFEAANSFNKELKRQQERGSSDGMKSTQEETPAQAKARYHESMKLRVERIIETFGWLKDFFSSETS